MGCQLVGIYMMCSCLSGSLLLMFDHDTQPLFKVLLHSFSTSLKQVLNAFDFGF